jgi:septal ring-binding cell division protein DamX
MGYGTKRGGAGERVLEGRHVIGLFMAVILLSGLFFTLGYVMGRNQDEAQAREVDVREKPPLQVFSKPETAAKRANKSVPAETPTDTGAPPSSEWEFYHAGENKQSEDRLKPAVPVPARKSEPVVVKTAAPARTASGSSKNSTGPLVPGGGYTLQVAAMTKEADALDLARQLQKRKFPAFVVSPRADKYYRVEVGPYADQKAADAARKGLEDAGFKKVFVKR